MLWEYFSRDGMDPIFRVEGTMTSAMYREMLETNILGRANDRMKKDEFFIRTMTPSTSRRLWRSEKKVGVMDGRCRALT